MSESDLKVEKAISRSEALLKFIEEAVFDKVPDHHHPEIANRKKIWGSCKASAAALDDREFILTLLYKIKGDEIVNMAILHTLIERVTE